MTTTPKNPGAFKRAAALYMQALELKQQYAHDLLTLQMLINALPAYVSRGHGQRPKHMAPSCMGKWTQPRSKYQPHQGKSECARRVFQALPKAQRDYIRSIEREVMA